MRQAKSDLVLAPHHRARAARALQVFILKKEFTRDYYQETLDLETFLRSSNLPFAIQEYILHQQTQGQGE